MKLQCRSCGCHFDDDFEETLLDGCRAWKDRGLDALSAEHKRAIWDAYFSIPVDEIADDTGVMVDLQIRATRGTYPGNQFEEFVPGYKYMTDRERRIFQKAYFSFVYNQHPKHNMSMYLRAMGMYELQQQLEKDRRPNEGD